MRVCMQQSDFISAAELSQLTGYACLALAYVMLRILRPAQRGERPACRRLRGCVSDPNVEPIKHHDLVPDLHEVFHESGVSVAARVHLGNGTKLAVGAKNEVASRRLEGRFAHRAIV